VGLGVWTAHSLASCLLVLSAFFIALAFGAFCRIEAAALARLLTLLAALAGLVALLTALLAALLATRRAIILRITSRRILAAAFACALFQALISFSVVCH
jgi:hypothetical protein